MKMREISRTQDKKLAVNNNLDSSCEGVIMRAGQPFTMRYPLVEVEGSYGNQMESGNWSAPRYTASRLSSLSEKLFVDLKKDTITEWRDNYDDTEQYPVVLPTKGFYNVVNGSMGIAVGASCSIPQFNIKDVNKALETLLLNPNCSFDDIYCAPDFATGALLINEPEAKEAMKKGFGGSCKLRSVIEYDGKDNCFIVREIPYRVYTNTICKELEALCDSEDNPGIDRFNDLTGEKPEIKIYIKKGINPDKLLRYLYKNTSLQSWYSINFTMLDQGRFPKVFGWKEMLQAHIDHEVEVYRRGYEYDVRQLAHKIHILEGLIICIANIEEVVQIVKQAKDTATARAGLVSKFILDDEQAQAVLDMKLSRLTHLEIQKLESDKAKLEKEKAGIEAILGDVNLFNQQLINGWRETAKKYGDDRRTKIVTIYDDPEEVEDIPPEDCVVVLTNGGKLKRIASNNFKIANRNTKGVKVQEENTSCIIRTNTTDKLMVFTNKGKMYTLPVDSIPEGDNSSLGYSVDSLLTLGLEEKAEVIYSIYRDTTAKYLWFITKQGNIKRTALEEYKASNRKTGVQATSFAPGDELASVFLGNEEDIIIVTEKGQAIRIKGADIRPLSKAARGIKGIDLREGDCVRAALPVRHNEDDLAIIHSNGTGQRMKLNELPIQNRAGKGLKISSLDVGAICLVEDNDKIIITTQTNSVCISAKEIPTLSRNATGAKLINSINVISVTKV